MVTRSGSVKWTAAGMRWAFNGRRAISGMLSPRPISRHGASSTRPWSVFLRCFAASERLWELEAAGQIEWDARGEFLEREIRRIDPMVFADENNIWSFLVEELNNGVVSRLPRERAGHPRRDEGGLRRS